MNKAEQTKLMEEELSKLDVSNIEYNMVYSELKKVLKEASNEEETMDELFYGTANKKRIKRKQKEDKKSK